MTTTPTDLDDPQARPRLDVAHLAKTYGSGPSAKAVIGDLHFTVDADEFVCLVGRSGIGKTTLLRCLCGLLEPTGGAAYLDGDKIVNPPAKLAVVFQEYTRSLMPWLTVTENVLLPVTGTADRHELDARCAKALAEVGLGDVGDRYPWQLSGGMQQRVAIARALAYEPEVLLMDEPFASVDAQTRFDLEDLILRLRRELGITVVLVTHDIDEAVYLADRVIVLAQSPCVVAEIIAVDLPQPRQQVATRSDPQFVELRTRVLSLIQNDRR
jgi:NitT/TauT family transport system ATP-binding protein